MCTWCILSHGAAAVIDIPASLGQLASGFCTLNLKWSSLSFVASNPNPSTIASSYSPMPMTSRRNDDACWALGAPSIVHLRSSNQMNIERAPQIQSAFKNCQKTHQSPQRSYSSCKSSSPAMDQAEPSLSTGVYASDLAVGILEGREFGRWRNG